MVVVVEVLWLWHKIKNSTKRAARMTCAAARAFRLRVGKKCTGRQREEEKKKKKKKGPVVEGMVVGWRPDDDGSDTLKRQSCS